MTDSGQYTEHLLSLPVHTTMRTSVPTVSPLDTVALVADVMIGEKIGAVVVVDGDRPVGIVTERDLLERVIKTRKDFESTTVKDVMSKPLITIEADDSASEALDIMRRHNIKRLIVTKNGAVAGITTERRLLTIAYKRYMMKGISAAATGANYGVIGITVGFLSSYPPRECGIATYTKDLVDAISDLYVLSAPVIFAVNDKGSHYNYGGDVKYEVDQDLAESYEEAARYVNASNIDVISLQHEFGLFGGAWGEHVIHFLEMLKKPIITCLHTVLLQPDSTARRVLKGILQYSNYVIVMAKVGVRILEELYETFPDKVRYVPHWCPNGPLLRSESMKRRLGLEDRITISTFGLLSRSKGIEYAIEALPKIAQAEPRVLYLVIGQTHPQVRKHEGETYRAKLSELVESLGLDNNVRFVNRFLRKNELIGYLQATDIYVIPYPNREQISSGTLLYALSTGKAIVSTPFLHAEEVISEGCAMECSFKDPTSIADCAVTLLKNDDVRRRLERRAYEYSRAMIWPQVAMRYVNRFYEALKM